MKDIITIGIWIVILPSILLILVPLINNILNDEIIDNLNTIVWYIDTIIWSTGTNLLFATIWIILVMPLIRRILSFFNTDNKN